MTQPSNRSDNIIALPQNKSLATRKAFFKEKNLVNYLAWFAASIDCHLFSADLPKESANVFVSNEEDVELVRSFLHVQVLKFFIPLPEKKVINNKASSGHSSSTSNENIDGLCSDLFEIGRKMAATISDSCKQAKKIGFSDVPIDSFLVVESQAWPKDPNETSPYSKNPLEIIKDFVVLHYPIEMDKQEVSIKIMSEGFLSSIDFAMDAFLLLSKKVFDYLMSTRLTDDKSKEVPQEWHLFVVIMGWSALHRMQSREISHNDLDMWLTYWWGLWCWDSNKSNRNRRNIEKKIFLTIASDFASLYEGSRNEQYKSKQVWCTDGSCGEVKSEIINGLFEFLNPMFFLRNQKYYAELTFEFIECLCAYGTCAMIDLSNKQVHMIYKFLEQRNHDIMCYEGLPKALPLSCFSYSWFNNYLSLKTCQELKSVHFDILLGYMLDNFTLERDGNPDETISYLENTQLIAIIEKSWDESYFELAEAFALVMLHTNMFNNGTLEPWKDVAKAFEHSLNMGSDHFQRFFAELLFEYEKWYKNREEHRSLVAVRLQRLMQLCKFRHAKPSLEIVKTIGSHYPMTKNESENIMREKIGRSFNQLDEMTRSHLIDSEYLYRSEAYRKNKNQENQLESWNSIILQPFQAMENELACGWRKVHPSEKPPELGKMLYAIEFVLYEKTPKDQKQKDAIARGNDLLRIFPGFQSNKSLVRKLKRLVASYRNPASHAANISLEKLEKSRRDLYDHEVLRDFFMCCHQ